MTCYVSIFHHKKKKEFALYHQPHFLTLSWAVGFGSALWSQWQWTQLYVSSPPLAVSCPAWPWCAGAPEASGRQCPACWQRGAAGWPCSPGMKLLLKPQLHHCLEVCCMNPAWVTQFRPWIMYILFLRDHMKPVCLFPTRSVSPPPADHLALSCDVSKEQEVQKAFEAIQKQCGNITYLVNSAGINRCVCVTYVFAWM